MYLATNIENHKEGKSFLSGYDFSKKLNYLKRSDPNYLWIREYSSKAIKDAIMTGEKSFKKFFRKQGGFPRFKSRKRMNKESFFFIKDGIHYLDKTHLKLPILGTVRITESNYLPPIEAITSGRVIRKFNKFYVSLIYETERQKFSKTSLELGIDVGVKNYCSIASNIERSITINHFKDTEKYQELDRKILRLQQILNHKVEINYGRRLNQYLDDYNGEEPNEKYKNIMKGESYNSSRIRVLKRKLRKLYEKKANIRKDFILKLVNSMVKTKPCKITIEDISISNIIKHSHSYETTLHKYISESAFYYFKISLINKCNEYGITLRIADKYFASSKTCSLCGYKKKDLKLNDRIYICPDCGLEIDRDLNAAINLLNLEDKKCEIYA